MLDINGGMKLARYKWEYGGGRFIFVRKKIVYQENSVIRDSRFVRSVDSKTSALGGSPLYWELNSVIF